MFDDNFQFVFIRFSSSLSTSFYLNYSATTGFLIPFSFIRGSLFGYSGSASAFGMGTSLSNPNISAADFLSGSA